jgi:hypothetical protein
MAGEQARRVFGKVLLGEERNMRVFIDSPAGAATAAGRGAGSQTSKRCTGRRLGADDYENDR